MKKKLTRPEILRRLKSLSAQAKSAQDDFQKYFGTIDPTTFQGWKQTRIYEILNKEQKIVNRANQRLMKFIKLYPEYCI